MSVIHMLGLDIYLIRKPIKNINLRIDSAGHVTISAPLKCPIKFIQEFLHKKQSWIVTHQARLSQRPHPVVQTLKQGEEHFFLGQSYPLKIHVHPELCRIVLEDTYLCCYVTPDASYDLKRRLLTKWQRQQIQLLLPELIQKWTAIIGVTVNQWVIREMKTRWGSCIPSKKRICLNLYLIKYPLGCLEYVLVHELVHLLEASHNKRFYTLMNRFMPEWSVYKNLLKHQSF